MKYPTTALVGLTALVLSAATPASAQPRGFSPVTAKDVQEMSERMYAQARSAIENGQYDAAIAQLNSLIGRFDGSPESKNPNNRVDAALYWKAYSEAKQRQMTEALDTVAQLKDKFADSRWLKDAMALALEVQQSVGQPIATDQPDEDLKLLALRGLMHSDPSRGLPMVEQILSGNASLKVKENAVFVLSQSRSPKAQEILGNIARRHDAPELQLKAIRYLGAMRNANSGPILDEVFRSTSDERIKLAVLKAHTMSTDRGRLITIAGDTANSLRVRGEAIQQLGVLKADAELIAIYNRESSPDLKRRVIHGLSVSRNTARMIELARAEKDPSLKRELVERLSHIHSKESSDFMVELLK